MRKVVVQQDVEDVNDTALQGGAPDHRAAFGRVHALANEALVLTREARERRDPVHRGLSARDVAVIRVGEGDRAVDNGLENALEVEARLRDLLAYVRSAASRSWAP